MSDSIVAEVRARAKVRYERGDGPMSGSHPDETLRLLCYEELVRAFPWISRPHEGDLLPSLNLIIAELRAWRSLPPLNGTTAMAFMLAGEMANSLNGLVRQNVLFAA